MSNLDFQHAYFAGLIDGDGCILIKRRNPSHRNGMTSPSYTPSLSIEMTDLEPIQAFVDCFGITNSFRTRVRGQNKPIHSICVEHTKALEILELIRPFLIGKKQIAEIAIELGHLKKDSRIHRTKPLGEYEFKSGNSKGKSYKVYGLSDEYITQCETLYQKSKIAPRTGTTGYARG